MPSLNINGKIINFDDKIWGMGKIGLKDILLSFTDIPNLLKNTKFLIHSFSNKIYSGDKIAIFSLVSSIILFYVFLRLIFPLNKYQKERNKEGGDEDEDEKIVPRDFTIQQLREFDGTNDKPIYISLRFDVFDVTSASSYYGQGSGYHCFAGREASRAMAKLSFEEEELSNIRLDDLTPGDRGVLDDWYNKFKYHRSYPIVGRISIPPTGLQLTKEQLSQFKGIQEVPKDRVNAPIYVSINRKILDVSYGGYEMYGVEGSYHLFAGIDASKALAKMSFDSQYLNNLDLSDLTPEELQVLADWDKRLCSKYPQVGILIDSPTPNCQ